MSLFSMFSAMDGGPAPQVGRTNVHGFTVSTVLSPDMGHETAIIAWGSEKTCPVERYDSEEDAKLGHARWVQFVEDNRAADGTIEVTQIGYGDLVDDEKFVLLPGEPKS
jgi:hypothetical protein